MREILKKAGKNQKEIAELLGVSESTIFRELTRNQGKKGYLPKQAQIKADNRKKQAAKALKMTPILILLIEVRKSYWIGPEQVSGQLEDELGILISHERIYYQHIWADKRHGGTLYTHLRQCHKNVKRNMDPRINEARSEIVSVLTNTPPSLPKKPVWEIDTVIG